jgi:hypothetical protein
MVKKENRGLDSMSDREYIAQQFQMMKEAEKRGNHKKANRIASDLATWLGID